jgi:acetyl esterase
MLGLHGSDKRRGEVSLPNRSHWDPEMAAFTALAEAEAAKHPPVLATLPLEPHRRVNDLLGMRTAVGGPEMAHTTDRWIAARGRRIFCRVFRPFLDSDLPTLVYFHGGGWVWANVDTHDRMTREYAASGPVNVVSVDYALSPEAKFPQALEECAAVVRWLSENGAKWGIDGSRLLLGGDSAGGNLALATALLLRDTNGPALKGVLANYPVSDSRFDTPSYKAFGAGGYGLNLQRMSFYWDVYVAHDADRLNPLAAPLRAELSGLPPVMVLLAELDVLRSEGEALVEKLRAARNAVETRTFSGVVHGFLRATAQVQKARDAVAAAGDWMRRVG